MQHSRKIQVFILKQFNNLQIHPKKYNIGLEGLPLSCNPPVALQLALLVSYCSPSLLSLSLLALLPFSPQLFLLYLSTLNKQ